MQESGQRGVVMQDLGGDYKNCNKSIAGDNYPQSLSTPILTYGD
jgi:hypothetical protein